MTESTTQLDVLNITADIVCAYISNNHVEVADIQGVMQKIHSAVQDLNHRPNPDDLYDGGQSPWVGQ